MTDIEVGEFLNKHNYDLRLSRFSRWIDQKCTPDVLWSVTDFVLNYVDNGHTEFNSVDIWKSEYARDYVNEYYSKPGTTNKTASSEYDKFFAQPLCLLCYSGALKDISSTSRHKYIVANRDILDYISNDDMYSLRFLQLYIQKVLEDTGLFSYFEKFFDKQTNESYQWLKDKFIDFYHEYTPVKGDYEPKRIFTKVLNPLAYKFRKRGSEKGHLSPNAIIMSDLMYNQNNFRDIYMRKPKDISRQEWLEDRRKHISQSYFTQKIEHSQRELRENIEIYRGNVSELTQYDDSYEDYDVPSQLHHIFPKNEYPEIMQYIENIIALTPNQHFLYAHPANNTQVINHDVQYQCLLAKIYSIQDNACSQNEKKIYSFMNLLNVVQVGLDIPDEEIRLIRENDFDSLVELVNKYSVSLYEDVADD